MQRVLILCCAGSGKTTLANHLTEISGVPIIYLNHEYWLADWTETEKEVWQKKIEKLVGKKSWILHGNYLSTLKLRSLYADTLIFLDLSTIVCFLNVFKRLSKYWGRARPELNPGCVERTDWLFYQYIWTDRTKMRPQVLDILRSLPASERVIILHNRYERKKWIKNLKTG